MNKLSIATFIIVPMLCIGCGGGGATSGGSQSLDTNGNPSGEIWVTDTFGTDQINLRTGSKWRI